MMALLELHDICSGYGDVQILWGTNLAVEQGKLTALVGGNGSGKTTFLRTLMGLIRPTRGEVRFQGEDITHLPAHKKADLGLILVPEGRQLFSSMSVAENLEMGAAPPRARSHLNANLEKIYTMFPHLKERSGQQAGTLSGGEQQMLAVARGLMAEPVILMIDELSLGLSPAISMQLLEALLTLRKSGMTILLVEQNVQMALVISDYAYVLAQGRTDLEGPSHELIKNEQIKAVYLGLGSSQQSRQDG
jgi:branched-chain amino acid transport system ATP-binding protein